MIVHFLKTGEKRYAVEIEREGLPTLEMNPAPGYDPLVPHDLMHLIVEAVLGLDRAIYGQLADGGDAGSFHIKDQSKVSAKDLSRLRKKQKKKGNRLRASEDGHFAISENATYVCWHEWLSRSKVPSHRSRSVPMKMNAAAVWERFPATEARLLKKSLDRTCDHLDELSAAWSRLKSGERISVRWPDLKLIG